MIKVNIKKPWMGKIAIRDKFIEKAIKNKENIVVECEGQQMTILYKDIRKDIKGRSSKPFKDKFSDEWHYLYYYEFKPQTLQKSLL